MAKADQPDDITRLLNQWREGDHAALEAMTPLIYAELRKIAAAYMQRERDQVTLQPTALIHEAYVRLVDQTVPAFKSRTHFFGVAARLMRQVLVDFARSRQAVKRGGQQDRGGRRHPPESERQPSQCGEHRPGVGRL